MNIHIELVKKWIADPASVTQQELKDNLDDAIATYEAAIAHPAIAANTAVSAANAAYYASHYAAIASYTDAAKYWVRRYEIIMKEKSE
jgi:hypothetical protein